MFKGTLIGKENADKFLSVINDSVLIDSDIFIGVYDDKEDVACGVLSASAEDDGTVLIRHIYVDENYRHKGAGTELFNTLIRLCYEIGAIEIRASYIRGFDINEDTDEFFDALGLELQKYKSPLYLLNPYDIELDKYNIDTDDVVPLSMIDNKSYRQISDRINALSADDDDNDEEDLKILPIDNRIFYHQDLSCAYVDAASGNCRGIFLLKELEHALSIELLHVFSDNGEKIALSLIKYALDKFMKSKKRDVSVLVNPSNERIKELLNYVTGGNSRKIGESVTRFYSLI